MALVEQKQGAGALEDSGGQGAGGREAFEVLALGAAELQMR